MKKQDLYIMYGEFLGIIACSPAINHLSQNFGDFDKWIQDKIKEEKE